MESRVAARRRTRRATLLSSAIVAALLFGSVSSSGASATPTTFQTSTYGTGTSLMTYECWYGSPFKLTDAVTVSALIGGGTAGTTETGLEYSAAIFAGSFDGTTFSFSSVVASAAFPGSASAARQVALAAPVTLDAGSWYFLAQGGNQEIVGDPADGGQYRVSGFDSSLVAANPLFSTWGPNLQVSDGAGGCHGSVDSILTRTANRSSSRVPDVGFVYEAIPTTTTTTAADTTTTTTADATTTSTTAGATDEADLRTPTFTG